MTNLLLYLYKLMLRLYPSRFYQTFGPEMAEVFAEKLHHAAGNRALLVAFARELRHWPGSLLREHWAAQQAALNSPNYEKLSWWGTAVAVLPFLLMALSFGVIYLVAELIVGSSPGSTLYNTATAVVIGIFIIGLAIAWWWDWPGWSVSWLGLLVFLLFYVTLPQLILGVQYAWDTPTHLWQTIAATVIPALLLFGAFYWLVGRWSHAGAIVLLLPLGLSWTLRLGSVSEGLPSLIFVLVWCWLAVVSVLMIRLGNGRWSGWFLGVTAVGISLISLSADHFWVLIPLGETVTQLMDILLPEYVLMLLPLMAILLFHALRQRLVRDGRSPLRYYRFLFWGTIGIIVAGQTGEVLTWPYDLPALQKGVTVLVTAVFLLGVVGMMLGVNGLQQRQPGRLLLLLVLFPLLYQAQTLTTLLAELFNWDSFNQFILQEMIQLVSQVAGLIWLALAAWLLGQISPPLPTAPVNHLEQNPIS